jgi:hypothetical protein
MRGLTLTVLLAGGIVSAIGPQLPPPMPQQPPRDARAGGTGTAQIGGTVVANEQPPRPLAAAHVGVLGIDNGVVRLTSSDDAGRFLLSGLPAGRYLISGFKAPYVSMVYGAKAPGRPGTAVAIADGERRTDVILPLTRGGVITGVITSDTGMPAPGIGVTLIPATGASLQTQMMATAFLAPQVTDDRGAYRFSGLIPGDYVVAAVRSDQAEPDARTITPAEFDEALRLLSAPPPPPAPGDRPFETVATAVPRARDRGGFSSGGPVPMMSMMVLASGTLMYAPVYYPGTVEIGEARPIRIAAGEERDVVDMVAPAIATSKIEGTLIGPDGQPTSNATLRLRSSGQPELVAFALMALSGRGQRIAADGSFALSGVSPGRYTLEARTYATGVNPAAIAAGAAAGFTPPKPQYFASADIVVTSGQPLTGIELRLQSGSQLTGRIVFRPTQLKAPADATSVMIALAPAVANDPLSMINNGLTRAGADGTFVVDGVIPGRYVLTVAVAQPGQALQWMPQSLTVNGRESLDLPIEVKAGASISDIVAVLSDEKQEVQGTLQDETGRPAPAFIILLFPVDPAYWIPNSRRVISTRPATNGRYSFAGPLGPPPGEYYLAALTDLDPADQYKPSVLAEIAKAAIKLTVTPGSRTQQDIRIAKLP